MNWSDAEKKEKRHQEDLDRLRSFRPMDDTFMRGLFKENLPLAELVLRIITGKPDLILTKCETQADMKRVTGARSICLDAYATDSAGKKYDIEVQRADNGADPHRARYHSSVMDVENLDEKQDYKELPDTYIIFITENDILKAGLPIYHIDRMIRETGKEFGDGAHIIYVNSRVKDDTKLGRLMQDFTCTNPNDMNYPVLAQRVRYFKEDTKGVATMCRAFEEVREDGKLEGKLEGARDNSLEVARSMLADGVPYEVIAKYTKLSVEEVRALDTKKSA